MSRKETKERRVLTILWRIENFSYCKHRLNESGFQTPEFRPHTLDGKECYLRLCTNDKNVHKIVRLSFRLLGETLDYPIDCEWSFLDSDGLPQVSGTVCNHITRSYELLDLPDCPTQEEVFETRKSSFLPHDILTVRCRIWKSLGEFEQSEPISVLSRFDVGEHSLVWSIEKFTTLQLYQDVTTLVELPTSPGKVGVKLKLFLKGESIWKSMVNCEITDDRISRKVLIVKVSVLNNGQKAIAWGEMKLEFSQSSTSFAPVSVSRRELMSRKSEYLVGDVLTLRFVFTYIVREYSIIIEGSWTTNLKTEIPRNNVIPVSEASCQTSQQSVDSPDISQERSLVNLGEDFLSLYRDHSLSDFELRSGDVSFPVHKTILSARSMVFRAMFSSDMKESDSNFLDVPDVDAHALNRMLIFMYAGTVDPLQWEGAVKLYYAADKFQIPSLKQQCSSFLRSSTTVSNVSDILTLADRHQDQELTSFVHDFILIHYDAIMQSVEWESFLENDPCFAGKTMHQLYKKKLQLMNH